MITSATPTYSAASGTAPTTRIAAVETLPARGDRSFGDWVSGLSDKARATFSGGIGGAVAGALIGMLVLGPVGAIAGAVIGGVVTFAVIRKSQY